MPDLSVVVVNYNTREATAACLRSVLQATGAVDLELIVVDNGSSDGSAAVLRERFPAAMVIEACENLGFARGVNRGARAASGEPGRIRPPNPTVCPRTSRIGNMTRSRNRS